MRNQRQASQEILIDELKQAGAVIKGKAILCPFHPDKNPSGGVFQGKDFVWRYKCQACGTAGDCFDIESKRTGESLTNILRKYSDTSEFRGVKSEPKKPEKVFDNLETIYNGMSAKHGGQLEALHEYKTLSGKHYQYVIRWRAGDGTKKIFPAIKIDKGIILKSPQKRILYRLAEITEAETVIVCEGELKCDILSRYGYQATTSLGGCKAAKYCDWTPLKNKRIIIWPDADLPGTNYASDVENILRGLDAKVSIIHSVDLDLKDGEDAVDYVRQLQNAGYGDIEIKKSLAEVFSKAKSTGAAAELTTYFEDVFAGRCRSIQTGFSELDQLVQIMLKSITLMAGNPGASKSLLVFQLAAAWILQGIKTAIFALEKDRPFHLSRLLAQQAKNCNITNTAWVEGNQDYIRRIQIEHRDIIESFGQALTVCPEKIITQTDIIDWAKQKAESGHKVIIIDPVTLADRKSEPYKADALLMQELGAITKKHRTAIFLVIHPQKTVVAFPDLMQLAGGAAYSRFCDNVVWLENHEAKQSTTVTPCGTTELTHDRTLWILKSRDAGGTGARIAYEFCKQSLSLEEIGLIVKRKKQNE